MFCARAAQIKRRWASNGGFNGASWSLACISAALATISGALNYNFPNTLMRRRAHMEDTDVSAHMEAQYQQAANRLRSAGALEAADIRASAQKEREAHLAQ